MHETLLVYTPENGPLLEFIKALRFLCKKYGYIYNDQDRETILENLIKKEYDAIFINDSHPRLVFKNEKQKNMFLIRFN